MWNRMEPSWQDPWKNDQQQGGGRSGWYNHPSDAECQPQFDPYAWQPGHDGSNMYGNHSQMPSVLGVGYGAEDHGGMENHHHQQQQHHHHHGMQGHMGMASGIHHPTSHGYGDHHNHHSFANQQQMGMRPPATGQNNGGGIRLANGQIFGATNGSLPVPAKRPTGSPIRGGDADDAAMMADLEESMRNMLPRDDGSDDEDANKRPAEATQEEREEAEQIVRTAFREAKERDRLREKVKKASQEDLQAMLNSRIGRK